MRTSKILIGLVAALVLSTATGPVSAHHPEGMQPPPPMSRPMGPSGISADKQYLYVVVDGKIMQFGAADMKLVKTVDLPKPAMPPDARPADAPPQGKHPGPHPPFGPPMAGPLGIHATEGFLYVVAGPVIHQFSTPDLKLRSTVELPRPEIPKPEHPQAGN